MSGPYKAEQGRGFCRVVVRSRGPGEQIVDQSNSVTSARILADQLNAAYAAGKAAAEPSAATVAAVSTPATMPPLAVPAEAAARLCGCRRGKWYALHAQGLVPNPVHVGKRPLWRVAELDAWMQAGCPNREDWEAHKAQAQRRGRVDDHTPPDAVRRLVEAAAALVRFFDSVRPGGRVLASDPDIDACRAALADLGVSIDRTDIGGTR